MDPGAESHIREPRTGAIALTALVGALLLGAAFAGGASGVSGILPIGGAAVVLLTVSVVAVAFGWLPVPRLGADGSLLVAAALALALWIGATMGWSIVGERSWDSFNKAVAYCAFLGLGLVLAAAGRTVAARLAATMLSVVLAATLGWALLTKVVPGLDPEGDRVARLREPIGYWNALALLADVAIVLGLWLATESGHRRAVRVGGALLTYVAVLALLLTLSRAGVIVGVAVIALWLGIGRDRVQSGLVLLAAAAPAALIGAWAFTRPALTEDATRADREADGLVLGILVVVGALIVGALVTAGLRRGFEDDTRKRVGGGLVALAAALVVAGGAAASVAAADAFSSDRDCSVVVSNDPSRLGSLDPNLRLCWWEEALEVFEQHGALGAGAGTFEIARKRFREDAGVVTQPHSVPLQQLADGGVAGIALFVALMLAGGVVCVCALRRLDGPERAAAAALVAAPFAYGAHALVDFNWDFLAVTAPTMVALGVLAGAGRSTKVAERRQPLVAIGAVFVAAVVLTSFAFPRLADRAERRSTRELVAGDTEAARDQALWARFFNPLSADPLLALARVAERQGRELRAQREYIRAIELQPENPETWYTHGIFQFDVRDNMCAAYRSLNSAYTLDPVGNQWIEDGPLDIARDAVNAGGCALGS